MPCTEGVRERWLTDCGCHFPQSRKISFDNIYYIQCPAMMLNDGSLNSTVGRFITLFSSNINNTSMLLSHQPIAALAEQPPDNKASLYTHTRFLQRCLSPTTDGVALAFISSFICHPFRGLASLTGLSGRFRAMFS